MGSVTIRNIDDEVKRGARMIAASNGRSLEAELRDLLKRTYAPPAQDRGEWLRSLSGKEAIAHLVRVAGGVGLDIPEREAENIEWPEL
jgi:antitoxin FitA